MTPYEARISTILKDLTTDKTNNEAGRLLGLPGNYVAMLKHPKVGSAPMKTEHLPTLCELAGLDDYDSYLLVFRHSKYHPEHKTNENLELLKWKAHKLYGAKRIYDERVRRFGSAVTA